MDKSTYDVIDRLKVGFSYDLCADDAEGYVIFPSTKIVMLGFRRDFQQVLTVHNGTRRIWSFKEIRNYAPMEGYSQSSMRPLSIGSYFFRKRSGKVVRLQITKVVPAPKKDIPLHIWMGRGADSVQYDFTVNGRKESLRQYDFYLQYKLVGVSKNILK